MTEFETKQKQINKYHLYYFPDSLILDIRNDRVIASQSTQLMLTWGRNLLLNYPSIPSATDLAQHMTGVMNLCVFFTLKARPDLYQRFQATRVRQLELALVEKMMVEIDKLRININATNETMMRVAIRRAGSYPLIMMESCVPNTRNKYIEFIKDMNNLANIPELLSNPYGVDDSYLDMQIMSSQILPPLALADISDEQAKLNALKNYVSFARDMYIKHSNSIWFSLFHIHGATGRNRANQFVDEFLNSTNVKDAFNNLVSYLQNPQNGNTHPHSFRTMLLSTLIGNEYYSYSEISKEYNYRLEFFKVREGLKDDNTSAPALN